MHSMLLSLTRTSSRRAISGVLVLWLCVVAAGVWAPLARAQKVVQGVEQLCSGHGAPQWVVSPVAQVSHEEAATLHHLIDCPLCLPVLAPPPQTYGADLTAMAPQVPMLQAAVLRTPVVRQWPPARGPPSASQSIG